MIIGHAVIFFIILQVDNQVPKFHRKAGFTDGERMVLTLFTKFLFLILLDKIFANGILQTM